jgi:hypothetical protein
MSSYQLRQSARRAASEKKCGTKMAGKGGEGGGRKMICRAAFSPPPRPSHGRANKEGVISNLMHITIIYTSQDS